MNNNRNHRMNLFNLAAFVAVFATGLLLFTQFHVGHGSHRDLFLGITKSIWLNLHRAAAVAFAAGLLIHIYLHWNYMKNIAKRWKSGLSKKIRTTSFHQILLLSASLVVMGTGFYAWAALGNVPPQLRHHWIDVHNIVGLFLLIGLAIHIKRRWRRIFHRKKRTAPKAIVLTADFIPRRGAASMIFHNPFGRHTRTSHIEVNTRSCESCGACAAACRNGVLEIIDLRIHSHVHVSHPEKCRGCRKCVAACPNGAFSPLPKIAAGA